MPTIGVHGVARSCSRCRRPPARRSCSSGCPRRRPPTAARRALPSLTFELRLMPQPVASPVRSNSSALRSSHFICRTMPGDLDVAPVARPAVVRREVGQREAPRDVLAARCGRRSRPGRRWRPAARARSRSASRRPDQGVQRSCTLRKNTMPFGPQYSTEFGKTSMSMNGLQVWPAPTWPSSPQAWRRRNVVWPASTPVPNSSNSKMVLISPTSVGMKPLTPRRLWRTPA